MPVIDFSDKQSLTHKSHNQQESKIKCALILHLSLYFFFSLLAVLQMHSWLDWLESNVCRGDLSCSPRSTESCLKLIQLFHQMFKPGVSAMVRQRLERCFYSPYTGWFGFFWLFQFWHAFPWFSPVCCLNQYLLSLCVHSGSSLHSVVPICKYHIIQARCCVGPRAHLK